MNTSILLLGSCFAENIGQKMLNHKMKASINPTGISYNPISLANHTRRALHNNQVTVDELVNNGNQHVHFDFHGKLGHHEEAICAGIINSKLDKLNDSLSQSDLIFISLGSAIVFELIENNKVVSNCHKFPQQLFNKRLLDHNEVVNSLEDIVQLILQQNEQARIVFTVSPVRHTRHGLVENNRSKATLVSAVHSLCERINNVHYFPSYEILVDDLRDYRFYKKDLVHPSESAVDYIWNFFLDSLMDKTSIQDLKSIQSIMDTFHHRSMTSHVQKQKTDLETLKKKISSNPYSDRFGVEIHLINERIATLSTS